MALSEVRTQIYMTKQMAADLKKQAHEQKKSLAELVRMAIGRYLEDQRAGAIDWRNDPITRSLGSVIADADLSENHDKYLYGWEKKKKL
jgi:hypothetical protein